MQHEKKELETLIIHYFRNSYPEFPKGETIPSESPDFLVKLKNRRTLGIELTRLHPPEEKTVEEFRQQENTFRDNLIRFAQELFEQDSPFRLFVKFLFSEKESIGEERKLVTAVKSVNAIREALNKRKAGSVFRILLSGASLPPGIDELLIVNHPAMSTSVWERANNLGMSDNIINDIRQSVLKKDEKIRIYQKQRLNYYWLLVIADRLHGIRNYNLPEKILNQQYESRFQNVLLFDLMKANVLKLV
jgi:hypothetical protein